MPALITEIIPTQNFELVRDKIGEILFLELENQKTLQSLPENQSVYVERTVAIDKTESVFVNVLLNTANYSDFTEKTAQGSTTYYVDIYSTGKASDGKGGGQDSSFRLHKYLGLCRYILQSTKYKILGMPPGCIGGSYVDSIQCFDAEHSGDANFTKVGRLTFSVRIVENQELWQGVPLGGNDTQVKLSETDKGFKYEYIKS